MEASHSPETWKTPQQSDACFCSDWINISKKTNVQTFPIHFYLNIKIIIKEKNYVETSNTGVTLKLNNHFKRIRKIASNKTQNNWFPILSVLTKMYTINQISQQLLHNMDFASRWRLMYELSLKQDERIVPTELTRRWSHQNGCTMPWRVLRKALRWSLRCSQHKWYPRLRANWQDKTSSISTVCSYPMLTLSYPN